MQSMTTDSEDRVLCVGLVCLDIVKTVSTFPEEDTAQRCLDCVWQRGGNASNTSSVLALLGQPVEFFGTVSQSQEFSFLQKDFITYGVHLDHVVECPEAACPLSVVIVNTQNGSRTILHTNKSIDNGNDIMYSNRNLRELIFDDFKNRIDLPTKTYKWIHFECRPTVSEIEKMLQHVVDHNQAGGTSDIVTSLEFEKPRGGCEPLFPLPDYLFFSKEFAQHYGYTTMEEAVAGFGAMVKPGASVICAWGEKGAAAKTSTSDIVISPALQLDKVVDTLAAGDTFIAGTIFSLTRGSVSLREAIEYGCKVAGTKCSVKGLRGLASLIEGKTATSQHS